MLLTWMRRGTGILTFVVLFAVFVYAYRTRTPGVDSGSIILGLSLTGTVGCSFLVGIRALTNKNYNWLWTYGLGVLLLILAFIPMLGLGTYPVYGFFFSVALVAIVGVDGAILSWQKKEGMFENSDATGELDRT